MHSINTWLRYGFATHNRIFAILKYICIMVGIPLVLWQPMLLPWMLSINILVAVVTESMHRHLSAILGALLAIWITTFTWNDKRIWALITFFGLYCVWNINFCIETLEMDIGTAFLMNIYPVMISLMVLFISHHPQMSLMVFVMMRACIICFTLTHFMSGCHTHIGRDGNIKFQF